MDLVKLLDFLSQCELGAVLIAADMTVVSINQTGDRLLHGEGGLTGAPLPDFASPLCEDGEPTLVNSTFGEYLIRRPAPQPDELPAGTRLIIFRDASRDYQLEMLSGVVNQIKEGIVMCDAQSRLTFFNDPAVKLDSLVAENVTGEHVSDIYTMNNQKSCALPEVIRNKRPIINQRHRYTTRFGKNVDSVASTFPVIADDEVLGAFNVVEDFSTVDDLHKQIIDLQEKLVQYTSGRCKTKSALTAKYTFEDIIHTSAPMRKILDQCRQVAQTDFPVMLYGETGTGKELFAQSIHNASGRADGPFLAINCAALPENLLESLLFGSVKGAYTGAENRPGLFEQADHGTLLLDEINSMNITLQAKLLRVLQDSMIRRVGSSAEVRVDVRVLSCINIPPLQAVAEEKLRQDLFYRLGVINIDIPPLRDRKEDISLLSKHFIMNCNQKLLKNVRGIDPLTSDIFAAYNWPGNVRELQHVVEHAMIVLPAGQSLITPEYLPKNILDGNKIAAASPGPAASDPTATGDSLSGKLQDIERSTLCQILTETGGNISKAAQILKMSRQNLQYRIKRYKIDVSEFRRK